MSPRTATKMSEMILMMTMRTPKLAPIVREMRLRSVTVKMAMTAVTYYQLMSPWANDCGYLESPLWHDDLRVGREGVV